MGDANASPSPATLQQRLLSPSNNLLPKSEWSIDRTVNYALRDSDQGRGRTLIEDEMLPNAEASLSRYGGGARDNIHLSDVDTAVQFLNDHGGNVPFGFD